MTEVWVSLETDDMTATRHSAARYVYFSKLCFNLYFIYHTLFLPSLIPLLFLIQQQGVRYYLNIKL